MVRLHDFPFFALSIRQRCLMVFALVSVSILMRTYSESTHYLSPDSDFYLRVAQNVLDGKGMIAPRKYPFDEATPEYPFTVWPVGYPLMISATAWLTQLPVLPASKLLNLLLVAGILFWLYQTDPPSSWLAATYLMTFGKMEIISYTWSELPFVLLMLVLVSILARVDLGFKSAIWLTGVLIGLFLVRYAGLILFFFVAGAMLWKYRQGDQRSAIWMFFSLLISSLFVLLYFKANHDASGFYTGSDRIQPTWESLPYFTQLLLQGIANELSLARNYYYQGWPDLIYLTTLVVQGWVLLQLYQARGLIQANHGLDRREQMLIGVGLWYLFSIVILRKISPFDPFDFRILAPFSTPFFIALFTWYHRQRAFFDQTKGWVMLLMAFCYAMTLPKAFILHLLTGSLQ